MIQAIKFNTPNASFRGTSEQTQPQTEEKQIETQEAPQIQDKDAFVKKATTTFNSLKDSAVDAIKDINQVTSVGAGVVRGVVGGATGAVTIGVLGKHIKETEGSIPGTIAGTLKDFTTGAGKAIGFIPSLLKKSPVDNFKTIVKLPNKFFKSYLKGHKLIGALATATAFSIAAYRTIQGKLNGNLKNANVDHRLKRGHVE